MKATIGATGVLTITAETPLEQFALRQWYDEAMLGAVKKPKALAGGRLLLDTSEPKASALPSGFVSSLENQFTRSPGGAR